MTSYSSLLPPWTGPNTLNGGHFVAFTNEESPFILIKPGCPAKTAVKYPNAYDLDCLEGLVMDMLLILSSRLNFTFTMHFPADEQWGDFVMRNGTKWMTGIVGHVARKDGDFVMTSLSINSRRMSVIDYSIPFHYTARGFMLKKDIPTVDYFSFMRPFSSRFWVAGLSTLVVISIFMNLVNRLSPFDFHGSVALNPDNTPDTLALMLKPFSSRFWVAGLSTLVVISIFMNLVNRLSPFDFHGSVALNPDNTPDTLALMLKPFSSRFWVAGLSTLVVISIFMNLVNRLSPFDFHGSVALNPDNTPDTLALMLKPFSSRFWVAGLSTLVVISIFMNLVNRLSPFDFHGSVALNPDNTPDTLALMLKPFSSRFWVAGLSTLVVISIFMNLVNRLSPFDFHGSVALNPDNTPDTLALMLKPFSSRFWVAGLSTLVVISIFMNLVNRLSPFDFHGSVALNPDNTPDTLALMLKPFSSRFWVAGLSTLVVISIFMNLVNRLSPFDFHGSVALNPDNTPDTLALMLKPFSSRFWVAGLSTLVVISIFMNLVNRLSPFDFHGSVALNPDNTPDTLALMLKPFSSRFWVAGLSTLVVISIFMNLVNRLSPFDFHGSVALNPDNTPDTLALMLKPFSSRFWVAGLSTLVVISIFMNLVNRLSPFDFHGSVALNPDNTPDTLALMLKPFSSRFWVAGLSTLVVISIFMNLVNRLSPFDFHGSVALNPDNTPDTLALMLKPFSSRFWVAGLSTLVVISIFMNLVNRLSPFDFHGSVALNPDNTPETEIMLQKYRLRTYRRYLHEMYSHMDLQNTFWSCLAMIFHEQGNGYSESWAGRVALLGWLLGVLVLSTMYTAVVTSWLTHARMKTQIETVADLLNRPDMAFGAEHNSATYSALRDHKNPIYNRIFAEMNENDWSVKSDKEGFEKLEQGNFAVFMMRGTMRYHINQKPCTLRMANERFGRVGVAFGMQKGSIHLKTMNIAVQELMETGIIPKLEKKWYEDLGQCSNSFSPSITDSFPASGLVGVFIVLGISFLVGLVFLIFEYLIGKAVRRRRKRNRVRKPSKVEEEKSEPTRHPSLALPPLPPIRKGSKCSEN